jgi:hypothetical protein
LIVLHGDRLVHLPVSLPLLATYSDRADALRATAAEPPDAAATITTALAPAANAAWARNRTLSLNLSLALWTAITACNLGWNLRFKTFNDRLPDDFRGDITFHAQRRQTRAPAAGFSRRARGALPGRAPRRISALSATHQSGGYALSSLSQSPLARALQTPR